MAPGEASPVPVGREAVSVGREAESQRLGGFARQAVAGRGAAVLIDGEPGIGKTTLVDILGAECARLGMRVLRGAAEDLEQRLPFAAIAGCLGLRAGADEPGLTRVAGLLRGEGALGRSAAAANREFAVTEAILDLVDQWCAEGSVALILDDVQWADSSSIVVLHRLGQGIAQQPLFLVIVNNSTARDEAVLGLVRSLVSRGAQVLTLSSLSEPEVASLVERLLGAPPGPGLRRLVATAGGNPMYVAELVSALSRDGLIEETGGVCEVTGSQAPAGQSWVPKSLIEVIVRRLDFLPRKTRDTLEMAAVLGKSIDVAELSAVLDLSMLELSDVVGLGMASGLLVESGRHLLFRHDLIREALAAHMPAQVRNALQLRAGQVLADTGAPVERVAEHLLAGTAMDRHTVDWLVRAAESLIVRAPELAVRLLGRALATVEDELAGALRLYLVRAQLWEGSLAEAEQTARTALAGVPDPARECAFYWLIVQACYRQGRLADAVAMAEEALTSPSITPGEAGRFHGFAAICLFYLERFDAGTAAATKAIAAGEANDEPQATGLGYLAMSALRFSQGDMSQALALNERAMSAFGQGIQPDLQADPYTMRGYCLLELDRLAEADDALAIALRHNQETGGVYLTVAYMLRARLRFLDGRWDDALAEIQPALDSPDPLGQALALRSQAVLIAIHRGSYSADTHDLPEPDDGVGGRKYGYLVRWAQALVLETQAGPQEALDLLYPVWEHAWGLDQRRVIYRVCPDLARLAAAAGDQKRAQDLAATCESLAGPQPTDSLTGTAQLCRGLAGDDPDLLLAAAGSFRLAGWPLYEGHAYENAATILAQRRRTAEARDALDRALTLYTGLDAAWDISRAEARLRQAGIRRGVRGPRKRPRHGWGALTDTENRVAQLVAEGRSNPDIAAQMFLSRRTVQSHVSSILTKLSLSSRVELAISAHRRETD